MIESDMAIWIVSELIEGTSLRSLLIHANHLEPEQALSVFSGMLSGLAHAHERVLSTAISSRKTYWSRHPVLPSSSILVNPFRSVMPRPEERRPTSLLRRSAVRVSGQQQIFTASARCSMRS